MGSSERSRADIPATRTTELDAVFMKWLGGSMGLNTALAHPQ